MTVASISKLSPRAMPDTTSRTFDPAGISLCSKNTPEKSCPAPVRPKDVEEFVASNIAGQARGAILEGYIDTHSSQSRKYYDRKLLHMSGNGQALVTSYFTILLAGRWHDDAPVIWNFSKEISTRVASGDELAELRGYLGAE